MEKNGEFITNVVENVMNLFSNDSKKTESKQSSKNVKKSTNTNINNLPTKANTTKRKPNGDLREYGPDGKATKDVDYSHPHHHSDLSNPHTHDWTWDENDRPTRGPAYNPEVSEIVTTTIVAAGGGSLVYRAIRMLPSLIPGLWWSIPISTATP